MPVSDNQNSITAGPRGPVLMQERRQKRPFGN
jgi:catalase